MCSGIGKTYQFVENTTPESIEKSSSAQSRQREARHDEGDASDDVSNTAGCSSLQSTGDDNVDFVVDEGDEDENVEANVFAQSGDQQCIDQAVVHRPGQQRAQTSKFSLNYPVALYKPGQVMLMDHCKPTLLELWCAFIFHASRTNHHL